MAVTRAGMTEEEFMRLPEDGRKYELVDGEVKEVSAGFRHDAIVALLIWLLYPFARARGYLCGSQAGFRMASGNIRCPDVSFTLAERLPNGEPPIGFADLAPDLAIEILSPSDDIADLPRKLGEYFASGTQQAWLLEPEARRVSVYRSLTDVSVYEGDQELDSGDLLPGFRCRAAELFAVMPPRLEAAP